MVGEGTVSVQVGADLIAPIIKSKIEAAIVEELGKAGDLIPRIVAGVLSMKVDSDGKATNDNYRASTLLRYLAERVIREAANAAVREWVESKQPVLKAELIKQLDRQKASLAEMMVLGIGSSLKNAWKFNVAVEFETLKER